MVNFDSLGSIKRELSYQISIIKDALATFQSAPQSSLDVRTLTRHSIAVCEKIENNLDKILDRAPGTNHTEDELFRINEIFFELQGYRGVIRVFHEHLEFIMNSAPLKVPYPLCTFFKQSLKPILGEQVYIIFNAARAYNYGCYPLGRQINRALRVIRGLEDLFAPIDLCVLTFPIAEKNNTLLNCTLTHEAGHMVDFSKQGSKRVIDCTPLRVKKEIFTTLGNRQFRATNPLTGKSRRGLLDISMRWLSECLADLYATRIFGPISFLSLRKLALEVSLGKTSMTHPPLAERYRLIAQELVHMGWAEYLASKGWGKELAELIVKESTAATVALPGPAEHIRTAFLQIKKHILKIAREDVPERLSYSPKILDRQADLILSSLSDGYVLGEFWTELPTANNAIFGEPISGKNILTMSWFHYENNLPGWEKYANRELSDQAQIQIEQKFCKHTLKSLEHSLVVEAWRKHAS